MLTQLLFEKPDNKRFVPYEEFLEMPGNEGFSEWIEGEIIEMSPPGLLHQDISGFLFTLMRWHVEINDLGKVIIAPFQMRLQQTERGREPDILFVAKCNLERLTPKYLNGKADLVIEIISPESRFRDRNEKFTEYEREGIKEYWIIDPSKQKADFFLLNQHKKYEQNYPDDAGIYQSRVLSGFSFNTNWLWQEKLPNMRDILKSWEKTERKESL